MSIGIVEIRKKYWKCGKHEYGYRIGKAHSLYFVEYMSPAYFFGNPKAKDLKMYKTLKMAERYAELFEKKNPAISLEDLQKDIAVWKKRK